MWRRRYPLPAVPDDSAYFHILRESACPGPLWLHLQIDGQDIASLEKGNSVQVRLAPGEHRVHIRPWKGNLDSTAPSAKTITIGPSEELDLMICCERTKWFRKDIIHISETPWRGKIRDGQPATRVSTIDWSLYRFYIIGTYLRVELAGQTSFIEDNRNSDGTSHRQTKVKNEYTRTITVGSEVSHSKAVAANLGIGWLTIEAQIERTIARQYSIQQSEQQCIEQVLALEVPARSQVHVTVTWKTVWQEGFVRIIGPDQNIADIPFRFVHHLEVDRYSVTT